MAYWSVYVSKQDERLLKGIIQKVAEKKRWSFSQAVSGILREHLIDEKKRLSEEETWDLMTAGSFFDGYSHKDSIYDKL